MSKDKDGAMDALARDIKRQIRTEANARFLRRIPLFAVEDEIPAKLSELLADLDSTERRQRKTVRQVAARPV